MGDAVLLDARGDGIAIITLDRPEQRNAFGKEAREGRDAALGVAILTGAGDKAFCAGGDLKEMVETKLAAPPRNMFPAPGDTRRRGPKPSPKSGVRTGSAGDKKGRDERQRGH